MTTQMVEKKTPPPRDEETLDAFLKRLIAKQDGIKPGEVTLEYIRRRREELYRTMRFEIGSDYGGYDTTGLKCYTRDELDEIEKRVDAWFAKL